jgi:probable O-glycosylation ligase (exosortase A-associated)
MQTIPLSLIMGATSFIAFAFTQKHDNPRMVAGIWLLGMFAIWITLTTLWAELPEAAWIGWDTAFKTIAFATLLPFLIKSRTHVEALLLVIAFSVLGNTLTGAVKVLLTGGGYGMDLGLFRGGSGLVEGSTLATVAVSIVPILLHFRKHSRIFPRGLITDGIFYTAVFANVICAIGTYARAGLLAIGVLVCLTLWHAKRKVLTGCFVAAAVFATSTYFVSDAYKARMNTVASFQDEGSAMTRVAVWLWTIDYASTHPWGGGFDVWKINSGTFTLSGERGGDPFANQTTDVNFRGRAYHSIYFEVLGSHGLPGIAIFAAIILTFFGYIRRIRRIARGNPELAWATDFAISIRMSLIIYLCGGAFVGIAFQPYFYQLYVCAIALSEYLLRVTAPERPKAFRAVSYGAA